MNTIDLSNRYKILINNKEVSYLNVDIPNFLEFEKDLLSKSIDDFIKISSTGDSNLILRVRDITGIYKANRLY